MTVIVCVYSGAESSQRRSILLVASASEVAVSNAGSAKLPSGAHSSLQPAAETRLPSLLHASIDELFGIVHLNSLHTTFTWRIRRIGSVMGGVKLFGDLEGI